MLKGVQNMIIHTNAKEFIMMIEILILKKKLGEAGWGINDTPCCSHSTKHIHRHDTGYYSCMHQRHD